MEPLPTRIAVVCTGNICRSPMGAVILQDLLHDAGLDDIKVTSAGTGGWHVGEGADPRAVRVLRHNGYDGTNHVAQVFQRSWFATHDLVLAADESHVQILRSMARTPEDRAKVRLLRSFDPEAVAAGTLEVDDPWYGQWADFERCFHEIEAACRGVVAALAAVRVS